MVQTTSTLDVADNSGAKKIMCIRVLGGTKRKYASVGDVIVVSIKEAIPNAKVKKGDVARAVIVRTKKEVSRQDGSYIRFDTNSAVLVDKDNTPRWAPATPEGVTEEMLDAIFASLPEGEEWTPYPA